MSVIRLSEAVMELSERLYKILLSISEMEIPATAISNLYNTRESLEKSLRLVDSLLRRERVEIIDNGNRYLIIKGYNTTMEVSRSYDFNQIKDLLHG